MILRSCYSQVTENEVTDITSERYPLVFGSVSEIQKSDLTTEMPDSKVIFVQPQVITDKLNNLQGDMELTKEQDKTIATDIDIQTSTQSSISMLNNNMVKISDINNPLMRSLSEDLVYDKEVTQNLTPQKTSSIENTDKNKDSVNHKLFERLLNLVKLTSTFNDFQRFENNDDFTEDANRLMLNNQKDHALDTSNKIESLGLDVTTIANLKDSVDFKINFKNSVQDPKQGFFLIKDATQDNYSEESSSRDNEQVNASLDSDLVICPPYQSYESPDMSSEHSIKSSLTSQAVSMPEFLEQMKSISSDDGTKNKDKHNADDSSMLMATSSDASEFESDDYFPLSPRMPVAIQNTQDSSEMTANIKQEEEKHKIIKNIESLFNFNFEQPKIQDSVESSTSNDKFQWFNAPPVFANNLQLGLKDISELDKTQNPSLEDTIEDTKIINSFIPNKDKFHNECQIEIKMNSFRIKCPEERNLASPTRTADSSNVNFKDFDSYMNDYMDDYNDDYDKDKSEQSKDDLISNKNSDKKVASLQNSALEEINRITSVPSLKDAFDFIFKINSFNRTKINKQDGINSLNQEKKEEISFSSTTTPSFTSPSDPDIIDFNTEWNLLKEIFDTQLKQLKVSEKQDFLNSQNPETFLESNSHVYDLEKELTPTNNDEMLNFMKQFLLNSLFEDDNFDHTDICNTFPNFCPISSSSPWQLHVNLKRFLKRNHDDLYKHYIKDYNRRKKRMANLTKQHGMLNHQKKTYKQIY